MPLLVPIHSLLLGVCPCLPQATIYYRHDLACPKPQFTTDMPLLAPSHYLLQTCPCLPQATIYYRHALACPMPQFTTDITSLAPKPQFTTGSVPLLAPNYCLMMMFDGIQRLNKSRHHVTSTDDILYTLGLYTCPTMMWPTYLS